jgi:gluconolactonase
MFDRNGKLIVCEAKGQKVIRIDKETGLSEILANSFQGNPFNGPNDVTIDEKGNIYFTDSKMLGTDPMPQGVHGVYRIGNDGKLDLMIGGYGKPNGIIISPDQKTLYIATWDNVRTPRGFKGAEPKNGGKLIAFNLLENGGITFKQELVDLGQPADGMTIDMDGNIYITRGFGKRITVFSPSGEIIDELSLPDNWITTNATFGRGNNNSTLYITAGKTLYSTRTKALGYNLPFEE